MRKSRVGFTLMCVNFPDEIIAIIRKTAYENNIYKSNIINAVLKKVLLDTENFEEIISEIVSKKS